ncbi:MAG: toprim domain-containing protein, partial [Gammaproteobacteria bacterium]|nr:toprim domain-containing protein [Gammaproteobacteria bacterium]
TKGNKTKQSDNSPTKEVDDDSWKHLYMGDYYSLPERNIRAETLEKYKVKAEKDVKGRVIKHHYPYHNAKGEFVGMKTRIVDQKKFFGKGNTSKNNQLFGQNLFRSGGKIVTVVEGELDALSAYEMFDSRWQVVSVNNGANCVDNIKANLEWLDSFETVVICFDNDEAGREAAKKVAPLLGPNKCKMLSLAKHKDPSDYLIAGDAKEFQREFWDAKPFTVSGVASLEDIREALLDYQATELVPLPESFGDLQEMTRGGLARGELTSIIAHTSIGKTTILNELIYHFAKNTYEKIGCFMVEDNIDETVRKVVSVHTGTNLQLLKPEDVDVRMVMDKAIDIGFGSKIQLHNDGGGSIDIDEMFSKMRYFIKGLGCTVILVDPLHTAIKNLSNENIEDVMDRFIKLCKETKATVILSTHTRKPDDGSHPHKISEYDVKGSGAIPQACHNNILFSRDKLSEDDYEKNSIRIRVPKLRRTGQTGEAGWTHFDTSSGRLEKGHNPASGEDNDF